MLEIKNITVQADEQTILNNFNLNIEDHEIHALMGPNGVGKSTICKVLLNDPNYHVINGNIIYNSQNINELATDERAKLGFFLLNQTPIAIPGVSNSEMLRMALSNKTNKQVDILAFHKELKAITEKLNVPSSFIHRDINYGMSGGERKKNELIHLWMLKPNFIILDEVDSGLDVDSFKTVMKSLKEYYLEYKPSILIITHNTKILHSLKVDYVHVLVNGKIVKTGGQELASEIEENGYAQYK